MEILKIILPLIGVFIGALISGFSNILKARAERKKTIAIALADLLEVRHHMAGVNAILNELNRRFTVPAEVSMHLQTAIEQLTPIDAEVHKRYGSAVTLLAGIDPLLAYSLRSKNSLPQLLSSLKSLGEAAGISSVALVAVSDMLRTSLVPKLNEAVIELAGKHSWLTKRRVIRHIAHSRELPVEVKAIFAHLESIREMPQGQQPLSANAN